MENNDYRDDVLEQDIDGAEFDTETTYEDEEVTDDEPQEAETGDADDIEKIKAEAAKWKAIAMRNRKKVAQPAEKQKPITKTTNSNPISREEAILFAQGYSEADVELLSQLAKGMGVSMTEAKQSEVFEAYETKKKAEEKSKRAQLGASKGSNMAKQPSIAELSKDEHADAWLKAIGAK